VMSEKISLIFLIRGKERSRTRYEGLNLADFYFIDIFFAPDFGHAGDISILLSSMVCCS
jgi:hypothetical protein